MHPDRAALIGFGDAEGRLARRRRIARHLFQCEECRVELRRIEGEKAGLPAAEPDGCAAGIQAGLSELQSSMTAWRAGRTVMLAAGVRSRVLSQLEVYLGTPGVRRVDRPGMRTEELLARTGEILTAFLGPAAAEAVRDEVFDGLECARAAAEAAR